MSEVWKPIKGFIGLYEISDLGYVKNLRTGKLLKRSTDSNGYLYVGLIKARKQHIRKIHRLVCEAFNGPPPFEGADVLHRDDISARNIPSNLYWGTDVDNWEDRSRNKVIRDAVGSKNYELRG